MPSLNNVVVTGIGLISALGNLNETWESLLQNKTGIKIQQPFPEIQPLPLASISSKIPFSLTKITQTVVNDALKDAKLTPPLPECGIVIGSSRGFQGAWENFISNKKNSSFVQSSWLDNLPYQSANIAAQIVGSRGIVIAPMAACATSIVAIARAFELIKMGKCKQVIVGAVESPITPLTLAAFKNIGAMAKTGCYPFSKNREGLVLGEGGAVFVLETAEYAQKRGANIYGKILGFGLSCDAYHISAPSPSGKQAEKTLKDCLKKSNLLSDNIQFIHAHGTSTLLNDQMEANLIQSLFPKSIAVSSTKGATGHTLGASGSIGLAFSLKALNHQIIPPCVGLTQKEFSLNFSSQTTPINLKYSLCLSFGFGGQNGVIAIGN